MITVKVKNKLSRTRVYYIIVIVFGLNFLKPMMEILGSQRWPTSIELVLALCTGIFQVLVIFQGLLQIESLEPEEEPGA